MTTNHSLETAKCRCWIILSARLG